MSKFAAPPVRTELVGKTDSPTYPWERWFQAITDFLSAPQIPNTPPTNSGAVGVPGTIVYDANFIYVCVAKNQWKRAALTAF